VRFIELKKIADIKEALEQIKKVNEDVMTTSTQLMERRIQELIDKIRTDFSQFFKTRGFAVEPDDEGYSAIYKSIKIVLKLQEPGRREDDIPCFLKFRVQFSNCIEEVYIIFVQWAQKDHPGTDPDLDSDESSDTEADEIINRLQRHSDNWDKVVQLLESSCTDFQNKKNIAMIDDLSSQIHCLRDRVIQEKAKWQEIRNDRYVFLVTRDQDEWQPQISETHPDLLSFLEKLGSAN
jgi:hypothetical protein